MVITKVENTLPWTYIIEGLNGKEHVGMFHKREFQSIKQKDFKKEKRKKKKADKLYAKNKCHDISFNSWINKKDIL